MQVKVRAQPGSSGASRRRGHGLSEVSPRLPSARLGRPVYFGPEVGRIEVAVITRDGVSAEWRDGPFIVEEYDSTTVVPPGCRARAVDWGSLLIEVDPEIRGE